MDGPKGHWLAHYPIKKHFRSRFPGVGLTILFRGMTWTDFFPAISNLTVNHSQMTIIVEESESNLTASERCKQARTIWLQATTMNELEQVEALYRGAMNATKTTTSPTILKNAGVGPQKTNKKKRQKGSKVYAELSSSEYRQTGEKLSLLYCQSGRTSQAKRGLAYLGFECRLARIVLDYPMKSSSSHNPHRHSTSTLPVLPPPKKKQKTTTTKKNKKRLDEPCMIIDNFLHPTELEHLQDTFQDLDSDYWTYHNYQVEPPTPYFSYVMDLRKKDDGYGFLGRLAHEIQHLPQLISHFPQLQHAHMVEVWAHNRPHASGHQLHFDSDDEGRGGVRNPICSTILYLSDDPTVGGPSLVTNQRLISTHLATKGWLAHPRPRRLVVFDGSVLHGVIPGKGVPSRSNLTSGSTERKSGTTGGRRVTLMMAFWKDIQIRDEMTPGSARPFPRQSKDQPRWAQDLLTLQRKVQPHRPSAMEVVAPISLSTVYETLDGEPWTADMGMPDYDHVFQGF